MPLLSFKEKIFRNLKKFLDKQEIICYNNTY